MPRVFRELLEAVVLALFVFMLIQTSIRNFKVDGSSMHPTLESNQYLMVNKVVYFQLDMQRLSRIIPFWQVDEASPQFVIHPPERRDIIVFHFPRDPSKDFVKRVIGIPGDEVEIRRGAVYLNGEELEEPTIDRDTSTISPVRLGEKEYFVLGDNRGSSNDSRTWGTVPEDHVLGKVWFVYWPVSGLRLLNDISWLKPELFR